MSKISRAIYLSILFTVLSQIFTNNVFPKTIYELFGLPILSELPEELKCYIANIYIQKHGWWYLEAILPHKGCIKNLSFSNRSDKWLSVVSKPGEYEKLNIWDISGNKLFSTGRAGKICNACFNQNGDKILIPCGKLQLFALEKEKGQDQLFVSQSTKFDYNINIQNAYFSKNEDYILIQSSKLALLIDIINKKIAAKFPHDCCVSANFNDKCDKVITTSYYDKSIKIWDLNGKEINKFNKFHDLLCDAFFSPDEKKICAFYTGTSYVNIINDEGNEIGIIKHRNMITSSSFDKTSSKILTASHDGTAKLSNIDGRNLVTFDHKKKRLHNAIFNNEEDQILTACEDGTAKLWHINGKLLMIFNHEHFVDQIAINKEGNRIVTGSYDNIVKLWSLYTRPTLEQILLRRLLYYHLKTKLTRKEQIDNIQALLEIVSYRFDLDIAELEYIWNSMPQKVQDSLKLFLTNFAH